MIQNETKDFVYNAIFSEMEKAIEKHGYFKNQHEFYAVLDEEYEEAEEFDYLFVVLLNDLWGFVRTDNSEDIAKCCYNLLNYAFQTALEWIQVCAVIKKYLGGGKYD